MSFEERSELNRLIAMFEEKHNKSKIHSNEHDEYWKILQSLRILLSWT
jgi:hypothetical protein